jgi:excisionase family DNA binding protein
MELLTLQQVAKQTCTSVAFWRKQVRLRRIPVVRVGRLIRLDADSVRQYLAAQTRPEGSEK